MLIGLAADEVEGADTEKIASARVGRLPGTVAKEKKALEKTDDGALPQAAHQHGREQDQMVAAALLGVVNGASHAGRMKHYIGVGEQQPIARCPLGGAPHGVWLT